MKQSLSWLIELNVFWSAESHALTIDVELDPKSSTFGDWIQKSAWMVKLEPNAKARTNDSSVLRLKIVKAKWKRTVKSEWKGNLVHRYQRAKIRPEIKRDERHSNGTWNKTIQCDRFIWDWGASVKVAKGEWDKKQNWCLLWRSSRRAARTEQAGFSKFHQVQNGRDGRTFSLFSSSPDLDISRSRHHWAMILFDSKSTLRYLHGGLQSYGLEY